ncbi:hypothetical protein [Sphingobacterium hungaricum]|nr:hypothetical protein [Sphingobacterium hungaricum]
MKNFKYCYLLMYVLLFSCGKSNSSEEMNSKDDFASFMSGEAYLGSAKSILYLHGYEAFPSVSGKGSFSVSNVSGDNITVALICELSGGDGFSFGISGKQTGRNWSATFDTGTFVIQENGSMSGTIQTDDQEISWTGHLFDDRVMLDVKLKYMKQQGNITEGSIISTHLDLFRSSESEQVANGCSTIVWENRAVFNLYSGGVDMMRVPVCHD